MLVAHADFFTVNLEVGHACGWILEVNGKEAVGKLLTLPCTKEAACDSTTLQSVGYFLYLYVEISPLVVVVGFQSATLALLGNGEIGGCLCVASSIEETEIGI